MAQAIPKQVWRESYEQAQQAGEGITRCSDPSARLWWVEVLSHGAAPLRDRVRALSAEQALELCRARYPNAALVRLMEDN